MVVKRDRGYHVADDCDSNAVAACAGRRVHGPAAGTGWRGGWARRRRVCRGARGYSCTPAPAADHEEGEQDRKTIFFFNKDSSELLPPSHEKNIISGKRSILIKMNIFLIKYNYYISEEKLGKYN